MENGTPLFSFDVPDFWSVRTGGPREISDPAIDELRPVSRLIGMQPEDDDAAWLGFISPPGVTNFAQGRAYLANISNQLARQPEVTGNRSISISGLQAEVITATGRRQGRNVEITATMIQLPGARVAIGVAVLATDTDLNYASVLNEVFGSFRAE